MTPDDIELIAERLSAQCAHGEGAQAVEALRWQAEKIKRLQSPPADVADLVAELRRWQEFGASGMGKPLSDVTDEAADTIEALSARIAKLEAALGQCADWFQQYADGHTAKGDTDKARRNQDRADFARSALEGQP